nr:DUF1732 domain-containing protein [Brucepastera parasyntrophica]
MKSYNARFLDIAISQPYWLGRIENKVREYAVRQVQRGKLELNIRIRESSSNLTVTPDPSVALAYKKAVQEIADALDFNEGVPLSLIIQQDGVLYSDRVFDIDFYWEKIQPVLTEAFSDFNRSRAAEGEALCADIRNMISRIETSVEDISKRVPEMETIFKDNIRARFAEVLGNEIDEQRVLQETAVMLVKYTINEEIVRLRAHLASLNKELTSNAATGRKIDFICQEINREINTIGSKNQIIEVGQAVIEAKDALENIREQVRNIE